MSRGQEGRFRQAIAVTGGIGSGKSRVARWLAHACAWPLHEADAEVRALLTPGAPGWQRLRERLSPDYFDLDGGLRKAKLRQAIFNDAALRQVVEHALHPLVLSNLRIKIARDQCHCLVEVPLLYEVRWQDMFAGVLVVHAPDTLCCERVMTRDQIPEDQAMTAIQAQMPIMSKVAMADYRVDNSGGWEETVEQLEKIKKMWCPHR